VLFLDGIANWNEEKTNKSLNAHGVAIVEITKQSGKDQKGGEWQVVCPSKYARRITAQTPIAIGGPAAGDERLKTTGYDRQYRIRYGEQLRHGLYALGNFS
jgi:secreted PhoX family phosphatase